MKHFFNTNIVIVILLTLIAGFLHFYNINWGAPFYFHPDERNIASAVSQLHYPVHMNPQFFAYGSLPIYVIYFTVYATNYLLFLLNHTPTTLNPTFEQAILVSRIYSALFATLLIPLLFSLGKRLKNEKAGLLAAFFATSSTGFIQFAHFGTFEMWLTFFSTLLFWSCLHVLKKNTLEHIVFMSLFFGILISVKVSSLVLLPLPIAVIFFQHFLVYKKESKIKNHESIKKKALVLAKALKDVVLFGLISLFIFLITNPYVVLDWKDFISSIQYESGVAFGTETVFYTGNFINTTPGVYQLLHVFPFLINPLMTILFLVSFIYLCFVTFKEKNGQTLLLAVFFLILFSSQAVLYVKWTRYMMPTLPFILLTIALALSALAQPNKQLARLLATEMTILIILNSLVAFSYFKTVFIDIDSRILAVVFAQEVIPPDAQILSEPADLGVLPFQEAFSHLSAFNFYDLDDNPLNTTVMQLQQHVATAQYIILPSQRILQSRLENPAKYPKGYVFYKTLLNGGLGFKKIYETPCDVFCTIVYIGDPFYWWEQTASVFDHPTVMIFKKETGQ
jgi:hypothetical protein